MSKRGIKAFRLMAVSMAAAMVLNNSGMTVLAAGLDEIIDETVDEEFTEDIDEDTVYPEDNEEVDEEDSEDDIDNEETEDGEEIENPDEIEEDVLEAGGTLNLTADKTYTNNQLKGYDTINLNGHKLTVSDNFTTKAVIETGKKGELVVNGNMTASGPVDCKNGKLTVKGSYTQTAQALAAVYDNETGSTTVNISKDMIFKNEGYVYFNDENTKVTVGGNFVQNSKEIIIAMESVWTVKGNFTQGSGTGDILFRNLILAGTSEQTLTFQKNSSIGSLTVKNSNVTLTTPYLNEVNLKTDFAPKGNVTLIVRGLYLNGHKFTAPKGIEVPSGGSGINLGENGTLIVNGDMTAGSDVLVPGGTLTVKGNYTQTGGALATFQEKESNAIINVSKNMVIKDNGSLDGSGMDKVTVNGDFVYSSGATSRCQYSVWTVKGNFTQEDGAAGLTLENTIKMPTKGSSVYLRNGKIDTLVLSYGKKNYTIKPDTCYKKLIATCTLSFDANGGSVNTKNKKVTTEQKYGDLPVPTKAGSVFDGWYTKKTGGDQILPDKAVTAVDDFTVYAHWKSPQMNFDDVHESDWFYKAVKYVYVNGIMAGVNGGKSFNPGGKLTREQFTQVLYAYEGKPAVSQTEGFTDVDPEAWYAKSVYWAKEKGIAGGKPNGTFGVGENISRQDLAVMLYTYAKFKKFNMTTDYDALEKFTDKAKIANYAKEAMKWAVTQGIISGKGGGKVDPTGTATRAECAQMIMNLIEKNK
ncbi:MAG: S-layer homology domain-containing protein [Lachnospiraceae bacterium]|nr:S-layer homology domain-containing protein [Lachnospiraceae bacterium]